MVKRSTHPVYVIFGENDYLRHQALQGVIERELQGGDPSVNLIRIEGEDAEAATVLDEVRTFSLLGDRRVVVVEEADEFVTRNRAVLERYAAQPADSGCLVLVCQKLRANSRLYKSVQAMGGLIECKPVLGRALTDWLVATARDAYGKRVGREAACRLQEHAGKSQGVLDAELGKLATYVGGRVEITADDVDALVGRYREQKVFAVMDAIAEGNVEKALAEWQQVWLTDRAAPGRAIGGLAWAVRQLLEARLTLDRGASLHGLARRMWTDVDVLTRRLERCPVGRLEDQLGDLLEADVASKTGLSTVSGAVEKFIVEHSLAGRGT